MVPAPVAALLVALSLLPTGCFEEDITGCGDPVPVDEQQCDVVGYPGDAVGASADASAAPMVPSWSAPRVTLPESGTGWLEIETPTPSAWALVVTPPVPVAVFASPTTEVPVSGTSLDLPCDATGLLIETQDMYRAWVRIGPSSAGEVTVGSWGQALFACE